MRVALALSIIVVAASLPEVAGSTSAQPELRLVDSTPLVLRGSHFRAHEAVLVRVTVNDVVRSKKVRATVAGVFSAVYPLVSYDRCSDVLSAVATGRGGSRDSLKLPQAACPPRLSP
jgi:hypothetical protein